MRLWFSFMQCEECKNEIDEDKKDWVVSLKKGIGGGYSYSMNMEVNFSDVPPKIYFHKQCAPVSEDMKKILENSLDNSFIYQALQLKESNDLTYRECLEKMVLMLAENNEYLYNQLLRKAQALPTGINSII